MATHNSTFELRVTRALAHELWEQCRDSKSNLLELAIDLRRLRNLLEDMEERTTSDASLDLTSKEIHIQILKFKAILCGVDRILQSFAVGERRIDQPEIILAFEASIQILTQSLSMAFDCLVSLKYDRKPHPDGPSQMVNTYEPSPPASSTDGLKTSREELFDPMGPTKCISPAGHHFLHSSDSILYPVRDGWETTRHSLYRASVPSASPAMPEKWQSLFALPDPLTFDDSKACNLLTARFARPTTTIPECTIDTPRDSRSHHGFPPAVTMDRFSFGGVPPETQFRLSSGPEKRDSTLPIPCVDVRHPTGLESSPTASYMPYRRRFERRDHANSQFSANEALYTGDDHRKTRPTEISAVAVLYGPDVGLSAAPRSSIDSGVMSLAACGLDPDGSIDEWRIPPMPSQSPPEVLPQVFKDKCKPPIPPRRLGHHLATSSLPVTQKNSTTGASHSSTLQELQTSAHLGNHVAPNNNELPCIYESKHIVENHKALQRRASTGDVRLDPLSRSKDATKFMKYTISHANEPPAAMHSQAAAKCRPSSSSAPELTTPASQLLVTPIPPELAAESTLRMSGHSDADPTNDKGCESITEIPKGLQMCPASTHIVDICDSFNRRDWLKAESYLTTHLCKANAPCDSNLARRMRHLLGVCASYQGHWHRALVWFISVVNKPVRKLKFLDDGDKAAFYWLGDTYSILNRKEEALLAYCLAGSCCQYALSSQSPHFGRCLLAAQEQLRQIVPKSTFKTIWASDSFRVGEPADDELLHCNVVSQAAAQICLQSWSARPDRCSFHGTLKGSDLQQANDGSALDQLSIVPAHFEPTYNWAMVHDPKFNLQNVVRGGQMARPIDVLDKMQLFAETLYYESKLWPTLIGFSCQSVIALVRAVRESFQTLSMAWQEVVDSTGVYFLARYYSVQDQIFTTRYFRLQIVKLSIIDAYGLSVCSESVCSARTTSSNQNQNNKFEAAAKKELIRCLRATIKAVHKHQRQAVQTASPTPVPSPTPPIPPKPPLSPRPDRPPCVMLQSLPEISTSPI